MTRRSLVLLAVSLLVACGASQPVEYSESNPTSMVALRTAINERPADCPCLLPEICGVNLCDPVGTSPRPVPPCPEGTVRVRLFPECGLGGACVAPECVPPAVACQAEWTEDELITFLDQHPEVLEGCQ